MRGTPEIGVLIAIEGIDGAGKTTQVGLLADTLRGANEMVLTSKEPTNGPWGQKIRRSAENGRLPVLEEVEAFIRDREEHVTEKIGPALEEDKIVILDRYFYSTIAYQGVRGADTVLLDQRMKEIAPVPHMVIVLDLDPQIALERIAKRDQRPNEFENLDNLLAVREEFKRLSSADPIIHEVDGSLPRVAVHAVIVQVALNHALKVTRCAKSYGCDDPIHCIPRMTGQCRWANIYGQLAAYIRLADLPALRKRA